jgi:hypothetical protein
MHLLQIYKLFPFQEDIEEFMDEAIWPDWPSADPMQRGDQGPLDKTLLVQPDLDPQQWLLALHLIFTWPDRSDAALLMKELDLDAATAQRVHAQAKTALETHGNFYARLVKSLGSCVRCG